MIKRILSQFIPPKPTTRMETALRTILDRKAYRAYMLARTGVSSFKPMEVNVKTTTNRYVIAFDYSGVSTQDKHIMFSVHGCKSSFHSRRTRLFSVTCEATLGEVLLTIYSNPEVLEQLWNKRGCGVIETWAVSSGKEISTKS